MSVSYFVRYEGQAESPEAFLLHYRVHHVPILAHFPGIRRIVLMGILRPHCTAWRRRRDWQKTNPSKGPQDSMGLTRPRRISLAPRYRRDVR